MTPDEIAAGAIERKATQKHKEFRDLIAFLQDAFSKRPASSDGMGRTDDDPDARQKTQEIGAHLPKSVLEIGTLQGGTLWAWAQIADPFAKIVSVDLPGGEFGGGWDESHGDTLRSYVETTQELYLIRGDSHDEGTWKMVNSIFAPCGIDLAFIDGDHTFEGVELDWMGYSRMVNSGGYVVFHDILFHPVTTRCQVDLLWNDLKKDYETWEFCEPGNLHHEWGQWGGIGLLRIT